MPSVPLIIPYLTARSDERTARIDARTLLVRVQLLVPDGRLPSRRGPCRYDAGVAHGVAAAPVLPLTLATQALSSSISLSTLRASDTGVSTAAPASGGVLTLAVGFGHQRIEDMLTRLVHTDDERVAAQVTLRHTAQLEEAIDCQAVPLL